jgi:hypothetical protein
VLEALVLFLGALEQLVEETNVSPTPSTEDAIKKVVQPVAEGQSFLLIGCSSNADKNVFGL